MGEKIEKLKLKYTDPTSQQLFDNVESYREMLKSTAQRSDYQLQFLKKRHKQAVERFKARMASLDLNAKVTEESSRLGLE